MVSPRILVLSPWGLQGGYSGPLTLLGRLANALVDNGARIDVAYRDRGREEVPHWASKCVALPAGEPFDRRSQLAWGLAARRLLRETGHKYDIVHAHGFYLANQVALAGYRGDAKVVALPVLEGGDLAHSATFPLGSLKRVLLTCTSKNIFLGLALSQKIASEFLRLGVPAEQVSGIGNPANGDAHLVGEARRSRHSPPVIGFVGKIGGFKNPDVLVDAFSILHQRHPDLRANFVGPFENSQVESQIRTQVQELGLENAVTFTGLTDQVSNELARMDAFVLPSSREGLPGALCEAMAAALPCVVTDVGSMADHVLAASAGVVVDVDATSVANGTERALFQNWEKFSHNARTYASEHFDANTIARMYLSRLTIDR